MLGKTKRIHFIGIGGIGMSGIAELLYNQGFIITGSDMQPSATTKQLETLGIEISYRHDPANIQGSDVIVRSSAIQNDNVEVLAAMEQKIPVIRRAEMLAEIMRMSYGIGIAGTHGKTTTTSMVGMILSEANMEPTVIVGGVVKNYSSNNLLGSGQYIVVEADEFDRSFLSLTPIIAGITNIEADHLDCYEDLDSVKRAFVEYANKVPFFGAVICCLDDHGVQSILPLINKKIITYGMSKQASVRADNIEMKDFKAKYKLIINGKDSGEIELNVTGNHNIKNSLLAVALGLELDIPITTLQVGLKKFKGVFRRFEYKGKINNIDVYDDYAHHPTEIEATLTGIKDNTDRRIVAVFQPHLYSRTRDFYDDFGRSFFQSDVLLVTPIYPAREKPIPSINGQLIANAAIQHGHQCVHYIEKNEEIVPTLSSLVKPGDLVITIGAGDIYKYGEIFLAKREKNV
jgi:UDP-N-acetylmuramate--alanine ligase